MSKEQLLSVKVQPSQSVVKFGSGDKLISHGQYTFPGEISGHQMLITTNCVKSDITLLLSLEDPKKLKVKLDFENDSAIILVTAVALD